ncbi:unnamed protein product [Fraxinus pennsylvanica]|uniref:Uncharacterized protein n=1 Tax=Fraxinus pennsylvanica TaxID=56036 RepID=A0AAD1ZQL9_9LAMI|nr:unnamed protein product [Fraxinus pennsylvanica]
MLGLNKTTSQLQFLINWLVTSLLQLRFPGSNGKDSVPLVQIYGPKIKYERGAAVSFNLRDRNQGMISPEIVLRMAESHGISLGVGILSHTTANLHHRTITTEAISHASQLQTSPRLLPTSPPPPRPPAPPPTTNIATISNHNHHIHQKISKYVLLVATARNGAARGADR